MSFSFFLALIALVSWLASITTEDNRESYFVSANELPANTSISSTAVSQLKLDLQDTGNKYLTADSENLGKFFLKAPIAAGQLIPLSLLLEDRFQDCSSIVINLGAIMSSAIAKGDKVNLWSAEQGSVIESLPMQIVTAGELISIKNSTDGFSQSMQTVEVCVSIAEIRSVVQAIAKKATVVAIRADNQ